MDKRRTYLLGIDTETCNSIEEDNKSVLNYSLVYDIGYAITDRQGNIYLTRSFIVEEIFFGMAQVMQSAYYAKKIPMYLEDIYTGKRTVAKFNTIVNTMLNDMKAYNVNIVFAHNAYFDYKALHNTIRYITDSAKRYIFPYGTIFWDTLKMARTSFKDYKAYEQFCLSNGFVTKYNKPNYKAETLYRFITNDVEFDEKHTGLEDILIEAQILAYCFKRHKAMKKELFNAA